MANRFVSFLEHFGLAVLRGASFIPQMTAVVESSAGQPIPILDKLSQIWSLVKTAEVMIGKVMGPGSGPQKAAAIAPSVAQIVMSSEIVAGKRIAPDKLALFNQKCQELGGIVADIGNCLVPDVVELATENVVPTRAPMAVVSPAKPAPVAIVVPAAAPDPVAIHQAIEAEIPAAPGVASAIAAGLHTLPQE